MPKMRGIIPHRMGNILEGWRGDCWACLGTGQVANLHNPRHKEPCPYCLDKQIETEIDREIEEDHEDDGIDDGRG